MNVQVIKNVPVEVPVEITITQNQVNVLEPIVQAAQQLPGEVALSGSNICIVRNVPTLGDFCSSSEADDAIDYAAGIRDLFREGANIKLELRVELKIPTASQ